MPSVIKLNVTYKPFVLSVIILSVIRLNVIMLSVVASNKQYANYLLHATMQCFQNVLAYFATAVSYMHIFFNEIDTWTQFYKTFSSSLLMLQTNKLEHLSLASLEARDRW
jgi:hypothetical protein